MHLDESRGLSCWTTASSSTGISPLCREWQWSRSLQTMKERWSQSLRTCDQRETKAETGGWDKVWRTCWYQLVFFILPGSYWLAVFLGFALKPSFEDGNAGNGFIYRFFWRMYACLRSKGKGSCWGRCWSPWSPDGVPPALHDTGSIPDQGFSDQPLQNRQMWLNRLKCRGVISEMREKEQFQPVTLWGWYLIYAKACCLIQRDHCEKGGKVATMFAHSFLLLK